MTDEIKSASAETLELCLPPDLPPYLRKNNLRRKEVTEYSERVYGIKIATATLAKLAVVGGGPRYYKCGASVLYPRTEIDIWATAKLGELRSSTPKVNNTRRGTTRSSTSEVDHARR